MVQLNALFSVVLLSAAVLVSGAPQTHKIAPSSLGVGMQGGVFGAVITRNTPIPTSKTRTFTTIEDNQVAVTFPIYEGESTDVRSNRLLGEFELSGIRPAPKGTPELIVNFEVDAQGLVKVTAKDKSSSRKAFLNVNSIVSRSPKAPLSRLK